MNANLRHARSAISTAVLLAVVLLAAVLVSSPAPGATTNVTVIGSFPNFSFNPKVISINAGDTVTWANLAPNHTVTGDTPPEVLCGSPSLGTGCTNTFSTPGTYLYHCATHVSFGMTGVVIVAASGPLPPTVAITNPVEGAVYSAPAIVNIFTSAASTSGTVTNVQFFTNGSSAGSLTSAPFTFTTAPLAAGPFALTAKASASTGLSTSSTPVNISVVTPVVVTLSSPQVTNNQFVFKHTANVGLRYVVENTVNFTNWSAVTTNTAVSNSVTAADTFQAGSLRFYRVGRLPNP